MRYMLVLQALGNGWEARMRAAGVEPSTIESWGVYYRQLTFEIATCTTAELPAVGQKLSQCFATALYYMGKGASK